MSLLSVRKKFIELSGRFDLVEDTTDYVDNGANWFINSGQKVLDRMLDSGKTQARAIRPLKKGQFFVNLTLCRAIQEVVVSDTNGASPVVCTKDVDLLHKDFTGLSSGKPSSFFPTMARLAPDTYTANVPEVLRGASVGVECWPKGVLLNVKADKDYLVDVYGIFYSKPLQEDEEDSYWSQHHEDTLVLAALYRLEVFYRNTTGARDWLEALTMDTMGMDMDEVAEEIAKISQIGG